MSNAQDAFGEMSPKTGREVVRSRQCVTKRPNRKINDSELDRYRKDRIYHAQIGQAHLTADDKFALSAVAAARMPMVAIGVGFITMLIMGRGGMGVIVYGPTIGRMLMSTGFAVIVMSAATHQHMHGQYGSRDDRGELAIEHRS